MTKIEEVAAAMYQNAIVDRSNVAAAEWKFLDPGQRNYFRAVARAAIEAMREPTGGMFEAGKGAGHAQTKDWNIVGGDKEIKLTPIWHSMIDAALSESSK